MKKRIIVTMVILLSFTFTGCKHWNNDAKQSVQIEPLEEIVQSEQIESPISTIETELTETDKTNQGSIEEQTGNTIYNSTLVEQAAVQWATAYCKRDGNALYQLFNPSKKQEFFQLKNVNSKIENNFIDFGEASPWPKDNNFSYYIEDNKAEIMYYAMSSELHAYAWKENLTIEENNGIYYIASEQIKEYTAVTTKEELMESIGGNFQYSRNGLNYKINGLAYKLNRKAINDKAGVYADLFSPERAAGYLLNLLGGTCEVKTQYKTFAIVTYHFQNGDTIDLQMIQPFGAKGIWLVEDVDVAYEEDNLLEIQNWFQNITIEDLNQIKTVISLSDIEKINEDSILLLASIPEDNIYLYGYRNQAVILRKNDRYQLFNWVYLAPVNVLPVMGYGDYDNDGQKEIAVSLHIGTGTGVSVDQCYLINVQEEGFMEAMEFAPYQYIAQLKERIKGDYDTKNRTLQFSIDNKKAGNAIDISKLTEDGSHFSNIDFGQQIAFEISKDKITLNLIPGCFLEGRVTPEYDEMPQITANVAYKDGSFSLSGFVFDSKTE